MDPLDLEFDRYQRFRAAADLVEEVAGSRRLEILEVGGFDDRFRWFVPRHDLSSYDGLISRAEGGLGLPDSSCQVVVALDVLEHVAPGDRPFFLAELARGLFRGLHHLLSGARRRPGRGLRAARHRQRLAGRAQEIRGCPILIRWMGGSATWA